MTDPAPLVAPSNALSVPPPNLRTFSLTDLEQFARDGDPSDPAASRDVAMFYVGVDDVHGALTYLLSRATISIHLNMFGYDDPTLNEVLMAKVLDPSVLVQITLDLSQAGGAHEKSLLAADQKQALSDFNTHFVIGQSSTHSISHTKGAVLDGKVAFEGSTNWSTDGEGTFLAGKTAPGGPGYKAQNNTLSVIVDPRIAARFQAELINEHTIAQKQASARAAA